MRRLVEAQGRRLVAAVGACLLALLAGGCANGIDVSVGLRPTVVAQQTEIAALQSNVAALGTVVALSAAAQQPRPAAAMPTPLPPVAGLTLAGTTKGSPQAKVTITEYSDFQCPFCARYALTTARMIDEAYVKSGQVRVVFRNHAGLGQESSWAAEAALCAADQDKFWEYHDKLFESWNGENEGTFAKPNLVRFATDVGLDGGTFSACLDSGKHSQQVRDETAEGDGRGMSGTPTFFVNGTMVEGAQPFDVFKAAIDKELGR